MSVRVEKLVGKGEMLFTSNLSFSLNPLPNDKRNKEIFIQGSAFQCRRSSKSLRIDNFNISDSDLFHFLQGRILMFEF